MKLIKTFEQWTTDVAGNYEVNYGDKPQFSEIVEHTINYIEENFDNISKCMGREIEFNKNLTYHEIGLNKTTDYSIHTIFNLIFNTITYIDISEEEYNYLLDFFHKINIKRRKINQLKRKEIILDDIDPMRKDAKKYNI